MTQETFPMIVGGEETLNERTLLTQVESGLMMNGADSVRFIVIHCSATQHRRLLEVGAHVRGLNRCSIGICYEGGLDESGKTADTRTPEQKERLRELLWKLHTLFPHALIVGHRDLPGVKKACPCFSCDEYRYLFH